MPSSLLHELAIIPVYFIIFKMIYFFAFCKQKTQQIKMTGTYNLCSYIYILKKTLCQT